MRLAAATAAIALERERRHWNIDQWRQAEGDEWPAGIARVRSEADAAADFLASSLVALRDAWNAHMATCPQHAALPDIPRPSQADLDAWRDAPSGTASA